MKKLVSLFAFVAISCAAFGAVLQSVKNVRPGEYEVKGAGKLTTVDVFSTEASGTVKIGRVFTMTHYTNAVDSTSEVVTNVVETKHYDDVFYRGDGVCFTNTGVRYSMHFWEAALPGHKGSLGWNELSRKWFYSTEWDAAHNDYSIGTSVEGYLTDDYVKFGTGAGAVEFSRSALYRDSTFATNVVTVVTTNSVTPVKAYDLTITNQVLNGTCSGGVYHGVPSDGVWLFTGDKIVFEGTATGGMMRMVIE